MTSKLEQTNRDNHGPPNKCCRCFKPVCRNLDGSWSSHCQHHKNYANKWNITYRQRHQTKLNVVDGLDTKTVDLITDSSGDEGNMEQLPTSSNCASCNGPTRLYKGSTTKHTKYCDDCAETTKLIYKAIHKVKSLKRKLENVVDRQEIRDMIIDWTQRRDKLNRDIEDLEERLNEDECIQTDYEQAKLDLESLL